MKSCAGKRLKMFGHELSDESSSSLQKISKNIEFYITDFPTLINISYYVNKIVLMRDVKDDTEMVLISAPRSFNQSNKSTNMCMLRKVVERKMNSNGERIEPEKG
ncbi:uncharacterized protein LOC118450238 [Vespa mandarinia]|uniref:uncharacterized protein LOC118450238 n=1 Tax=Vespa mandarinia TaxID=7446 RepID=UPI0016101E0F|nr:uncharacterized protein LOC118450238 [Vespa mandarinia]